MRFPEIFTHRPVVEQKGKQVIVSGLHQHKPSEIRHDGFIDAHRHETRRRNGLATLAAAELGGSAAVTLFTHSVNKIANFRHDFGAAAEGATELAAAALLAGRSLIDGARAFRRHRRASAVKDADYASEK